MARNSAAAAAAAASAAAVWGSMSSPWRNLRRDRLSTCPWCKIVDGVKPCVDEDRKRMTKRAKGDMRLAVPAERDLVRLVLVRSIVILAQLQFDWVDFMLGSFNVIQK